MGRHYKPGSKKSFDLIIVSGDLIVHGLSSNDPNVNNWEEMKDIIQVIIGELTEKYPDIPILFSIGNNDVMFHY